MLRLFSFITLLAVTESFRALTVDSKCNKPSPAFLWGEGAKNLPATLQLGQPKDGDDMTALVLTAQPGAEAIVLVLIEDGAGYTTAGVSDAAAGGGYSYCTKADAIVPYVYPSERRISDLVQDLSNSATTVTTSTVDGLVNHLTSSGAMTNGATDVIVVSVPADRVSTLDALLSSTHKTLMEGCPGAHTMMLAGDGNGGGCGRRRLTLEGTSTRRLQETLTTRSILMTPDILAGVLYWLFFLMLLWVGLGCLGDIEYPKTFVQGEQQPSQGREY